MTTTASCTEVDIHGFVNGRIRGRLLDEQGRPARGIEVHAVEPRSARTVETFLPVLRAMTDEQGAFEFRRVGPGRYLIGVELQNPVPAGKLNRRRFFGETRDPAAATVVDLGMAEQRELPPFKLIALPSERSMTIVLRAPGPEVAAATQLFVTGAARKLVDHSSDALTLRLPFGAAYQVEAVAPAGYRVERRFVRIDRDDTDRTIEFRIERQ